MNVRRASVVILAGVLLAVFGGPARAGFTENQRKALGDIMKDVASSLSASSLPKDAPISVLPILRDQDETVRNQLMTALKTAGLNTVQPVSEPLWNEVMKEAAQEVAKEEILDSATLLKFCRLQATKILVYGFVREVSESPQRTFVEIELHASSLVTKQHLWGNTFARSLYLAAPREEQGVIRPDQLPVEVREALKKGVIEKGMASLKQSEAALKEIGKVILVPLAGDLDGYVTGLERDLLAQSRMVAPVEKGVNTRAEARKLLRDEPQQAGGMIYGAVRDLSIKGGGGAYEVSVEVQLCVQKVPSDEVIWSATLAQTAASAPVVVAPAPPPPRSYGWMLWLIGGVLVVAALVVRQATRPR
jgi:hypothetical protein